MQASGANVSWQPPPRLDCPQPSPALPPAPAQSCGAGQTQALWAGAGRGLQTPCPVPVSKSPEHPPPATDGQTEARSSPGAIQGARAGYQEASHLPQPRDQSCFPCKARRPEACGPARGAPSRRRPGQPRAAFSTRLLRTVSRGHRGGEEVHAHTHACAHRHSGEGRGATGRHGGGPAPPGLCRHGTRRWGTSAGMEAGAGFGPGCPAWAGCRCWGQRGQGEGRARRPAREPGAHAGPRAVRSIPAGAESRGVRLRPEQLPRPRSPRGWGGSRPLPIQCCANAPAGLLQLPRPPSPRESRVRLFIRCQRVLNGAAGALCRAC